MQPTTAGSKITVTADGACVASHAGSRLLADLADRTGLTDALGDELAGLGRHRSAHDPGRVLRSPAGRLVSCGMGPRHW